eukprot:jgi/Picsp_1/3640/NSC_06477-R1_protein phosphatase methylesterase 1-like
MGNNDGPLFEEREEQNVQYLPSWEDFFKERFVLDKSDDKKTNGKFNCYARFEDPTKPVILCVHGGGYTGLTWAPLALALGQLGCECSIVAPDLRGHGRSETSDDLDLSIETLAADMQAIWLGVKRRMGQPKVSLVLLGHSMGAAVAIHAAKQPEIASDLNGIVVIDVVEGTAIQSLSTMTSILQQRPSGFVSQEEAIEWALRSGTSRNRSSACISIPGMLNKNSNIFPPEKNTNLQSGKSTTDSEPMLSAPVHDTTRDRGIGMLPPRMPREKLGSILESSIQSYSSQDIKQRDDSVGLKTQFQSQDAQWVWRTPLMLSKQYWEGWFTGLSDAFLSISCPKILILAGTDRLDTTLMVAQMQGKFQMVLVSKAGHAVHEDEPQEVASTLYQFIKRYKLLNTIIAT